MSRLRQTVGAFLGCFFIVWILTVACVGSISFTVVDDTGQTAASSSALFIGGILGLIAGSFGAKDEWRVTRRNK